MAVSELWVVGDRFASFAELSGVQSYSALRAELTRARDAEPAAALRRIRIGQGLSADEVTELEQMLADSRLERSFAIAGGAAALARARPCDRTLVHKRHTRNVMLSAPVAISDGVFTAALCLDDACDDLADHLTGYHIQGAVLAEAVRQLVLAVSEAFLLPEAKRHAMRFVTNAIALSYHSYAFPIAVDLKLTVERLKRGAGGNFTASAAIACEQNHACVASGKFEFTVLDREFVDTGERDLADKAIGVAS